MADPFPAIAPEQFATWYTPSEALAKLVGMSRHKATEVLMEQLQFALVKSAAEAIVVADTSGRRKYEFCLIPPSYLFGHFSRDNLWDIGQALIEIDDYLNPTKYLITGIRFDPHAVDKLVAKTVPQSSDIAPLAEEPKLKPKPAQRGPDVSEAHLRAWYELYRQVYTGASDTLPNAEASATGMFPGKFVSRQRVRDLCAGRKPGRKPQQAAD